ncbi:hypothetical protein E5288_WYG000235 [Bos mutus]|uniref:Uncharacterized protein n=1 Tax=Bos mutus TaxID=72004 RepID=A0A6B0QQS0_9CETA|nr:hypothetical protein [Bos mutus]
MLPGGLLHQLLPLLLRLLWGLLQRPRGLLPPPHLQLQLVWLRWWEGLLPAEELLSAEVQLPEAMLPLGSPINPDFQEILSSHFTPGVLVFHLLG